MPDSKGSDLKDDTFTSTMSPVPTRRVSDGAHLTRDDARLEDLGYRPELKRNFSKIETFGGECPGVVRWRTSVGTSLCRDPSLEVAARPPSHPCGGPIGMTQLIDSRIQYHGCRPFDCQYHLLQHALRRSRGHGLGMAGRRVLHLDRRLGYGEHQVAHVSDLMCPRIS